MKWLREIQSRLAAVPAKFFFVEGEVQPGERVIGRLPEDLLRMHALQMQMLEEVNNCIERHFFDHMEKDGGVSCVAFYEELHRRGREIEVLQNFFWLAVRYEFNAQSVEIGIRSHGNVVVLGSQEVKTNVDDATMVREFLKAMHFTGKPN